MSQEFKKFSSAYPDSTTETQLFVVPSGESYVATVNICNQSGTEQTYSIAHLDAAGTANNDDWLVYERTIAANAVHQITGIAAGQLSAINVKVGSANTISFVASGLRYY